ncbi:MAG TPA: CBS domain-containing protein [Planctomycetaceae bacterium]|nr:CBS domain-containing protein [Planctomycetaceae bacterium]
MSVALICLREVDAARPNESALVAARRMQSRHVGSLVIVDAERRPLGILTDRDLVVQVLAQGRDANRTHVGDVMSRLPTMVQEDTSIEQALRLMRSGPYRRLPVTDRDGRLVGVVSLDDILNLVSLEFKEIGGLLREESPKSLATG